MVNSACSCVVGFVIWPVPGTKAPTRASSVPSCRVIAADSALVSAGQYSGRVNHRFCAWVKAVEESI